MRIERDRIERLIPEGFPPEGLVPPNIRTAGESLVVESPLQMRSYLWASALIQAGFQSNIQIPPGLSHISAGLVGVRGRDLPLSIQRGTADGVSFGLFVLVRSATTDLQVQLLEIRNQLFPVVVVSGRLEHHGCPPHPANGASSCWARRSSGSDSMRGILTCRHVVDGLPLGGNVRLQPSIAHNRPLLASVGDVDESTIDAALLAINPAEWPRGLLPLMVQSPSAPGQAVRFEDRQGTINQGTVTRVFHYSTYTGNLFGQRVIADCYGMKGDSGSLLIENQNGRGVGLYMGIIPDGSGGSDGMFQDLRQVQAQFGLSLYR